LPIFTSSSPKGGPKFKQPLPLYALIWPP
jgi:hypothetical protein